MGIRDLAYRQAGWPRRAWSIHPVRVRRGGWNISSLGGAWRSAPRRHTIYGRPVNRRTYRDDLQLRSEQCNHVSRPAPVRMALSHRPFVLLLGLLDRRRSQRRGGIADLCSELCLVACRPCRRGGRGRLELLFILVLYVETPTAQLALLLPKPLIFRWISAPSQLHKTLIYEGSIRC